MSGIVITQLYTENKFAIEDIVFPEDVSFSEKPVTVRPTGVIDNLSFTSVSSIASQGCINNFF